MRVLVTGSDGFVGRHLVAALRARGDAVEACGSPGAIGGLEITDDEAVSSRIDRTRPEAVVHLAGISSVAESHKHPTTAVAVNVLGAMNLLKGLREHARGARVLLVGAGEEYGRLAEGERAAEDHPLAPLSPYAASKVAVEVLARQALAAYGMAVVFARPFNHLGAGQASNFFLPSFAAQVIRIKRGEVAPLISVGDLTPVRDFTHVLDVVDAYLLLLKRGVTGETYNICSGQGRSIASLLEELQQIAKTSAAIRVEADRLRPTEIPWLIGDPGRIEALGWTRRRTVRRALEEVLEEHSQ